MRSGVESGGPTARSVFRRHIADKQGATEWPVPPGSEQNLRIGGIVLCDTARRKHKNSVRNFPREASGCFRRTGLCHPPAFHRCSARASGEIASEPGK